MTRSQPVSNGMNINKNTTIWLLILVAGLALVTFSFIKNHNNSIEPTPMATDSLSPSPSISSQEPLSPSPVVSMSPIPSVSSQIGATVPWDLLPKSASCNLKGEIKFLNSNTYDNQDALFTYSGIDHPARNIHWAIVPEDNLKFGPNIFAKLPIPNGQSLIGIALPEDPKYKKYDLYAIVDYGRLVDAKGNIVTTDGNVKVFQKQCTGKTTVVLP